MKKQLVEQETSTIRETFNEFDNLGEKAPKHKSTSTPKAKEEMTRFNIYLSTKQLDKIKLLAVKEHKKIKELIEEAISNYLESK